ncbi:ABC transporter transmembrane domain-containing protein [Thalassospiraceae bacterium LMO-JJ14]|nr:ABC transporter transmembrane domain-containing protein [Thalassospiraceae bacterium LMO-JJ14]
MSRDNKRGTWRTIKRLEQSIPQVRWYRTELVLMSLFVNIFALGLPIFILQVYDRVLPNLGLTTMQFLVVGLIAVMLLDFFLKTARAAITTYTGARFEHLARVSAVDHILRTPQDIYENDTPGAYLDKVNAIGVVKDFYSSQLGTLLIDLPFAVFFLGMIWFLGGVMVAVPLVLLTLFGIMAIIVGGNLRRAVDIRSQVDNRRYDFLIEIINGIHTVKAQAFKNLLQRRFDPLQEMSARAVRSVAMQSSIAQSLGSTFGQLNMACVIGMGAILVIDGGLSAGELAACTLLSGRAMQPLQSAMGLWTNFQSIRVACDNAVSVLELPAEDMTHLPEMPKIKGDLELQNVTFGYEGMEEPLINNLNLKVNAGEMIGIDGDNSSGRSTLLKLMMGLIRPKEGAVLIDKQDLAKHQSQSYRSQMAFLTADSDVYSGSILDNMTYFRGGKYIGKAIKIARQLGLDDEIKRLPEGYGTHVGDGAGGVLPAGFIQRITVIRAMIDDPKVVLFDNANHGLDSNSDKTLMEYINSLRGRTTVILVTSRPSWLRMSDKRYVMSHGDLQPLPESEEQPKLAKPNPALPAPSEKSLSENAASKPQARPDRQPQAKPQAKPQARPVPKAEAQPKAKPVAKPAPAPVKPPLKPQARPQVRPTATPQAKRPTQTAANPVAQPQARPTPASQAKQPAPDATKPASAQVQTKPVVSASKKPAPTAAATFRAAPRASSATKTPNDAPIKPQPPKPRRTATFHPATGGAK